MDRSDQIGVALPRGTRLGHCEIREMIGRGGGGISYLAYNAHLEREEVIKEHFPPTLCYRAAGDFEITPITPAGYEKSLSYFCREARILAGLSHGGVVKVYDIFQAGGTAYMSMEYVRGERLTEWLPAHASEVGTVVTMLVKLLEALDYLHAHEVLHRDIKPSNIIIRDDGQPVLIDFGAAMLGTPPTTITLIGTPGYAAPEQFQPHGRVGAWSDLYALAHAVMKLIPPSQLRRYPRSFVQALRQAGAEEIEQRFASAALWLKAMQAGHLRKKIVVVAAVLAVAAASWYVAWLAYPMMGQNKAEPVAPDQVENVTSNSTVAQSVDVPSLEEVQKPATVHLPQKSAEYSQETMNHLLKNHQGGTAEERAELQGHYATMLKNYQQMSHDERREGMMKLHAMFTKTRQQPDASAPQATNE